MLIAKTEIRLIYEYTQLIEENYVISPLSVGYGNCPAIMLSPELYKKVALPVDLWVRQQCEYFSIHHCGIFDNYAEVYLALSPCGLDVGGLCDYKKLRKYYPDTVCSYIINPESIEGQSREYIDELIRGVLTDGGPVENISGLRSYGISKNAADDNLTDFITSAKRQNFV